MDIEKKTLSVLERDVTEYRREARDILDHAGDDLTGVDATRFDELTGLLESHNRAVVDRNRQLTEIRSAGQPGSRVLLEAGSPDGTRQRDEDRAPADLHRDTAMRTLERATQAGKLQARGAELVENLMRTGSPTSQTWTQRYAVAAGPSTTSGRSRRWSPTRIAGTSHGPRKRAPRIAPCPRSRPSSAPCPQRTHRAAS
ncbi:MAG: hypothetical protein QOI01_2368 [Mycobacterium sp.]|jgi:predicted phage gp36 major capsid-like protein|nr:hypothetical protein [Mycobacterium sp.]